METVPRAAFGNPEKAIGLHALPGPSARARPNRACALPRGAFGGEQNVITINMSEFQEAHSVSLLKGAPGYVGYGEAAA